MYHQYPYTDFHDMNLDWIIGKIKNVETAEANTKQYSEDAEASKIAAENAKDDAVLAKGAAESAKDDAVLAKGAAENARDAAEGFADDAEQTVSDTLDQIALLQSRVDNIIPAGTQTAGNTELLDIRVGANSYTYDSAGNAVRGQVTYLNYDVDGIKTDNLVNMSDFSKWKQGDFNSTVSYKVCQIIPATGLTGQTLYLSGKGWDNNSTYLYNIRTLDSANAQISTEAINLVDGIWQNRSITIPATAAKIAIVINTNNGSIPISPASIISQRANIYFGPTSIKSAEDFYYQYNGITPDPYAAENVHVCTNLFDNTQITMDTYWTGSGTGSAAGYYIADIPLKGGRRYVSNAINKDFSYYVTDTNYSTPALRQKLTTYSYATVVDSYAYLDFTAPEDGHLLLCGNTLSKSDPANVMVFEGSYVPNVYAAYGDVGAIYIGEELIYPQATDANTIIVAADGSGNFEKLKDGIDYAGSHQDTTIYVTNGTFDLITEFGPAYFAAFDSSTDEASGLQIGNGMKIIFYPNTLVTAHYTGSNNYVMERFSPFNLIDDSKGFTIEGLNLECSNCRYCLHDEDITSPTPYKNVIKNCSMKIDNSLSSWRGCQCIGGGLGQNGCVEITNCIFESVGVPDYYGIVSYHNGNGSATKPVKNKIIIKDNYFVRGTSRVSWYGTHTQMSTALVSNNSMTSAPVCSAETPDSVTVNMELKDWNNEIRR